MVERCGTDLDVSGGSVTRSLAARRARRRRRRGRGQRERRDSFSGCGNHYFIINYDHKYIIT